jgi:hypothetical protein
MSSCNVSTSGARTSVGKVVHDNIFVVVRDIRQLVIAAQRRVGSS